MTLGEWQSRLKAHFEDLRRARSASIGDKPIFALEHGLDGHERDALAAGVRAHVAKAPPSKDHALPWIVYAAEIGYHYAGDEYWQTFTEATPGWKLHGERDWIRERFRAFHTQFGGAKPFGSWASNFSIICWPITHAILPRDLQRQLAEVLYYMRDQFSAELLTSPITLGERIAARSWNATSRFQKLAEEPLLIGQIATALLLQGAQGSESLILPSTLKRIGADLDRVHTAREWLRGAQRVAQQRVQFRGLSSWATPSAGLGRPSPVDRAREQVTALAIEPRLVLRPSSADSWDVLLEIPDLSHLLVKFPAFRNVLTESRCIVAGSSGRPLARGALLHGPLLVSLRSWPSLSDVLLTFEQTVPRELEYLLSAECLLRPGPRWLFRVASDDLAYELRGNLVRPGQSYVLVSASGPFKASPGVTPQRFACEGIQGVRLDVPSAVPEHWAGQLEQLGLSQARNVHVWPAGLAAASWDGEGRAEWLTTERPCIGIRPDHAIAGITVTLGSAEVRRLDVASPTPGAPIYIELPPLSAGRHSLRVSARPIGASADEHAGGLDIVIREPRGWVPGVSSPGALRITVDPPSPTLEQLWEGRAAIEIRGPAGRRVVPTVSLFERRSEMPRLRKRLPPLPLPADAEVWRGHFKKHFRDAKDVQNLYDPAHTCHVELNAEELGTFSVTCEREFAPLRWVVRHRGTGDELTLVDDSGSPTPPEVSWYEFNAPDIPTRLDSSSFSAGSSVPSSGGLYRARAGQSECVVILSPATRSRTLQELCVEPNVQTRPRSAAAVEELLSLIRMWSEARLTGALSATKRRAVLLSFIHAVFAIVGGENWSAAERMLRVQGEVASLEALKRAVSSKAPGTSLAAKLLMDSEAYAALSTSDRVVQFAATTCRLLQLEVPAPVAAARGGGDAVMRRGSGPQHPEWLCEFALRLASAPQTLQPWVGANLRSGLERLLEQPILARAARFLVLAVDRDPSVVKSGDDRIYRGGGWE